MDRDEFYERAKQPHFQDEMEFVIDATNPYNKGTFTREGVDGLVDQIHAFTYARIMGTYEGTGKPPKHMRVRVSIEFDDVPHGHEASELPWYTWNDTDVQGLSQVDGQRRIPRTLDQSPPSL